MPKIVVNPKFCKGCGLCFGVCPKNLIKAGSDVNAAGYNYAVQEREEECTGCKLCAVICPDSAIDVYK